METPKETKIDLKLERQKFQMKKKGMEDITSSIKGVSTSVEQLANKLDPQEIGDGKTFIVKGLKGDKGDKGEQGIDGIKGLKGDSIKGDKGEQGIQGILGKDGKGIKGDKGNDGLSGNDGKNGIKGKDGSSDTPDELVSKLQGIKKQWLSIEAINGDFNTKINRIIQNGAISSLRQLTDVDYSGLSIDSKGNYILGSGGGTGGGTWGSITGTLSSQTDLQTALNLAVPYIGATTNVDLGSHTLAVNNINTGNITVSSTGKQSYIYPQYWDTYGTGFSFNVHDSFGMNFVATGTGVFNFSTAGSTKLTILNNGNVGIGTTSPTAFLHLKAGVATANLGAPLKFTAGTDLTTAETGAMEYDGTNLHFTPVGTTRKTIAYTSDLGNYVPYTGATNDINLNSKNLTTTSTITAGAFGTSSLTGFSATVATNTVIAPTSTQIAASPIAGMLWHDLLAFNKLSTPTFETYNGTTWSSGTLDKKLFAQIENQNITVIDTAVNKGVRWTWSGGLQWSGGEWIVIGFAWSAITFSATLTFEKSTDNITWTTMHTSTGTWSSAPYWFWVPSLATEAYYRLSITTVSATGTMKLSSIRLLTKRMGDQGAGSELSYPYTWDENKNIYGFGSLGLTGNRVSKGWFNSIDLAAGTASVAPLHFNSGTLLTTPLAGTVEFLTDRYYGTITTGAERKQFTFTSDLSSYVPYTGATGDVDLGTNRLQVSGADFKNGQGFDFYSDDMITMIGALSFSSADNLSILNGAGTLYANLDVSNITTTDKTFTFPDASGTIALLDSAITPSSVNGLLVNQGTNSITENTAVGAFALDANNSGTGKNTAIGYQSLTSNTTGSANVAIGYGALFSNTTGNYNNANGNISLNWNTTGNNNTANGNQSLIKNTEGNNNTAMGYQSLYWNTTGSDNTAIGYESCCAGNGIYTQNTLIGSSVGLAGSTPYSYNTAIGYKAGYNLFGDSNVMLGMFSGAYETGSNAFYVDNQDRTNTAGDKAKALMYGIFATTAIAQTLNINAVVKPVQAATAAAPTYVEGGIYYDLTLHKMRIGGATAWETITSV